MIFTYDSAVARFGNSYHINKEIKAGRLFRIARGFYSTNKHEDPYAVCALRYPNAVVTADSAFYLQGLTDVVPDRIHLATARNTTRITDPKVVQHFAEPRLLNAGKEMMCRSDVSFPVYSKERLLIEVMRSSASMPFDYYSELIGSFRKIIDDLDIRAIEEYMALFERNGFMGAILQREVL